MRALLVLLALSQVPVADFGETTTPALEQLDGWQGLRWGMSTKDVRRLEPKVQIRDGWLSLDTRIAGLPATAVLHFAEDKLKGVLVRFATVPGREPASVFASVMTALEGRYGRRFHPDDLLDRGVWWEGPKTKIGLELRRVPDEVAITYVSVALEKLEDQATGDGL